MDTRAHIIVRGRVQGVYFRASTVEKAQELGLVGWVKNGNDGESVEIVAEGKKGALEKLLGWAKKGPVGARVEKIEVEWHKAENKFSEFTVVR